MEDILDGKVGTGDSSSGDRPSSYESLHSFLIADYKSHHPNEDVVNSAKISYAISTGYRPVLPRTIPSSLMQLIEASWSDNVDDRPSFTAISSLLQGPISNEINGGSSELIVAFSSNQASSALPTLSARGSVVPVL